MARKINVKGKIYEATGQRKVNVGKVVFEETEAGAPPAGLPMAVAYHHIRQMSKS